MVRKGKAEQRVCKVVHSCSLGESLSFSKFNLQDVPMSLLLPSAAAAVRHYHG